MRSAVADFSASATDAKGSPPFSSSLVSPETLYPRSTTSRPSPSVKRPWSTVNAAAAWSSNQSEPGGVAAADVVPPVVRDAVMRTSRPIRRARIIAMSTTVPDAPSDVNGRSPVEYRQTPRYAPESTIPLVPGAPPLYGYLRFYRGPDHFPRNAVQIAALNTL